MCTNVKYSRSFLGIGPVDKHQADLGWCNHIMITVPVLVDLRYALEYRNKDLSTGEFD